MRTVSILTMMVFLLCSCSYHGTIAKPGIGGPSRANMGSARYNVVACIMEGTDNHQMVIDSGCGDTVIDFALGDYLQGSLQGLFAKTMVLGERQSVADCGLYIYPKQEIVCYGEEMVYNFEMRMKESANGRQYFSYKTSETGECNQSSPGLMFFSTLLFPPVLGGFFYAMNAHGKSKGNFEAAEVMIRKAIENNVSAFAKEDLAELQGNR